MKNKQGELSLELRKWRWRDDIEDCGGWQYLLGCNYSAHILCLTQSYSVIPFLLSNIFKKVTHLNIEGNCQDELVKIRDELGYKNIDFGVLNRNTGITDIADNTYDGVVIHNPDQLHMIKVLPKNIKSSETIKRTYQEICRILKNTGFAYYSRANRFGYNRIRQNPVNLITEIFKSIIRFDLPPSLGNLMSIENNLGLVGVREYPLIIEHGRLGEVVPEEGYRSFKNTNTLGEKLRVLLMNKWMVKTIAPAIANLAFKNVEGQSQMEVLRDEIASRYFTRDEKNKELHLIKYMALSAGKVVLIFGLDKKKSELVVFISNSELARERRDKEYVLLKKLGQLKEQLPFRIPDYLDKFQWNDRMCYIQKALPGMTMDIVWPGMEKVTDDAVNNLIKFNQLTMCPMRDCAFDPVEALGNMYLSAINRMPILEKGLKALHKKILTNIHIAELPAVFLHGDYKIENIMINNKTNKIESVIDWELSEEHGFPWIDMIYLILYNHIIISKKEFPAVFLAYLEQGLVDKKEQEQKIRYFNSLSIKLDAEPLLTSIFFIHHLAYREDFDLGHELTYKTIYQIIGLLNEGLND